jgi:hypothetical protein
MTNLYSNTQRRVSIHVSLVDVGAEFLHQKPYHIEAARMCSNVQGRGFIRHCLVDVGTKITNQAAHKTQMLRLAHKTQMLRLGSDT